MEAIQSINEKLKKFNIYVSGLDLEQAKAMYEGSEQMAREMLEKDGKEFHQTWDYQYCKADRVINSLEEFKNDEQVKEFTAG